MTPSPQLDAAQVPAWRPYVDADLAARARAAAVDIAEAIGRRGLGGDPTLGAGDAGAVLLAAYLERTLLSPPRSRAASDLLTDCVRRLAQERVGPSLYAGFTGVAWLKAHLDPEGAVRANSPIDGALGRVLDRPAEASHYDLVGGLVGFGVYALERLPDPGAAALLERIVHLLAARAEPVEGGVAWPTPERYRRHDWDRWNAGLAHGTPGAIAMLAAAARAGVATDVALALIEVAAPWVLANLDDDGRLPYSLAPGRRGPAARTAWCYGEAGVAVALIAAADAIADSDLRDGALEVARAGAARDLEGAGVEDAGICHGAAGLAHVYGRLAQRTGDPDLAAAARRWIGEALRLSAASDPKPDRGFLNGAAGTALVLLAASTAADPGWDRVLLLSSRAARRPAPSRGGSGTLVPRVD